MFVNLKVQVLFKKSKNGRIKILSTNRRLVVKGCPTGERKMWVKVSYREGVYFWVGGKNQLAKQPGCT